MNSRKKVILLFLTLFLIGVTTALIASARNNAGSENFQLLAQALPALSGASASQNHTLFQSGGEIGGGQQSASENFALHSGFWLGDSITPTPTHTPTPTPSLTLSPTPTPTLTLTPPPPSGPVYLPYIVQPLFYFNGPNEQEDNDNATQANGPLHLNQPYFALPDDTWDFFYVVLPNPGQITVDVTNHPLANDNGVQVQLYYQTVSPATRVGNAIVAPYHIEYVGEPGTYYLVVYSDVSKCGPCGTPYQLEVDAP